MGLSREQRGAYRKSKNGTEVAHVTRDSDTIFKVKRSRSQGRGHIVAASRTACYNCDSTAVRPDYDHSTFDILPHIFVWAAVIYFSTIHCVHLMGPACYNVTSLLLPAGWRFLMLLVTGSRPSRKCFFFARQHAMHTERDIVLPILSVCPMPIPCQNEWTYLATPLLCRIVSH